MEAVLAEVLSSVMDRTTPSSGAAVGRTPFNPPR
jgi:hypothetical protein